MSPSRRNDERPRAAIAGAGIAGLTTALALAQIGWRVSVFERADLLDEVGAGLQLAPNATRILDRLGVLERLRPFALIPEALRIRRGADGRLLALVRMGEAALARWAAPSILVHRADFQRVLLDGVARESDISIRLGVSVADFREEPNGISVLGGSGEIVCAADVLIGADGLRSTVRARRRPEESDPLRFSGFTAWRATLAAAEAPESAKARETNLWLGPHAHLVHYPLRGGAEINIVAIVEDGPPAPGGPREERAAALARRFKTWMRPARDLIAAVGEWREWPLYERLVLPRWSEGHVTLVGDAAHPMMPFLAQGAAQAIEDAEALAAALGGGTRDIPAAFAAYERARRARASRVQLLSHRQGRIYHLSGPAALARDLAMRVLGPERLIARYDCIYGPRT